MSVYRYIVIIVCVLKAITIYGQVDSLENRKIISWKLNLYEQSLEINDIDTTLELFQNYNPILRNKIPLNYLGNMGSPITYKVYRSRSDKVDGFIFSKPYKKYFHSYTNHKYYNTKRQFTVLDYYNTGPRNESEQLLSILHTQNVNKDLNFGINYDLISSEGRFQNQQVRENMITIFSSLKKKKYEYYTNINLNRIKAQENGGIDSLDYLDKEEYSNRKNIPVKLNEAGSKIFNTNFFFAHEYCLGKNNKVQDGEGILHTNDTIGIFNDSLGLIEKRETKTFVNSNNGLSLFHQLLYDNNLRQFYDSNIEEQFYKNKNIFIDTMETNDEIRQLNLNNLLALKYHNDIVKAVLSFSNEYLSYEIMDPDTLQLQDGDEIRDTVIVNNEKKNYINNNVSFYLKYRLFKKIKLSAYSKFYINGYKKANSLVNCKFSYSLFKNTDLVLSGIYKNYRVNYLYTNYVSNHFVWKNSNLRRIEEWDVDLSVINNKRNFNVVISYNEINNYLYLDTIASVRQFHNHIGILTGEISKQIKMGPIHSNTQFVYQKSTNSSIINIPEMNLYQSVYFERLSKFESTGGRLLWQVGFDYRFSSGYFADAYMPMLGLFHQQFINKTKDYHCLDFFLNFNIRRARIFLKYSYLNTLINKEYYFTSPYYPAPNPAFKFGLSWTFYD